MPLALLACTPKTSDTASDSASDSASEDDTPWFDPLADCRSEIAFWWDGWHTPQGRDESGLVQARFLDPSLTGCETRTVTDRSPRRGLDVCVLRDATPARRDVPAARSAGVLTLRGPSASLDVRPQDDGRYYSYFSAEDPFLPSYGQPYTASASGEALPAFTLDPALALPPDLVVGPSPMDDGGALPRGPVEVTWEPLGGAPLYLRLLTNDPSTTALLLLECRVTDDGAFTIPGELRDQLPSLPDAYAAILRVEEQKNLLPSGEEVWGVGVRQEHWMGPFE